LQKIASMKNIEINKDIQNELYNNILNENHPRVRLKNLVLYLKSFGLKHNDICDMCFITRPTLSTYIEEYKEKGIEGLKNINWKGQPSELNDYKDIIENDFEINPPKNVNEAQDRIEKLTGIRRCPTQIREFMKKLKFKYLKIGSIPGNGDGRDEDREQERENFKKKSLNHSWKKH
jgi:transposase